MASTTSPNMSLVIPTVGQEAGPQYASDINASLTIIDSHNHSPGSGVQINPEGIDINAALTFNNNPATSISYITLTPQTSPLTTLNSIYVAPGGTQEDLYFTDNVGNQIQITKNGIVNSTATSIPGESYSTGTFIWTQTQSSLPTTPANFDIGSITLRPNTAATTNGILLSPPAGIASQYTLTLPALPPSQQIMTLDASGNITAPYTVDNSTIVIASNVIEVAPGGITTTQINSSANIVGTQLSPSANILGSQLSASANIVGSQLSSSAGIAEHQLAGLASATASSSGVYTSSNSSSFVQVTNCSVGITGISRPILINFQCPQSSTTPDGYIEVAGGLTPQAYFRVRNPSSGYVVNMTALGVTTSGSSAPQMFIPLTSLNCVDVSQPSGAQSYVLEVLVQAGTTVTVHNCTMSATAI